jgi:hypothetical protein
MGSLYPYLLGRNGILKGLTLTSVYFGAHAVGSLASAFLMQPYTLQWMFRGWLLISILFRSESSWTLQH